MLTMQDFDFTPDYRSLVFFDVNTTGIARLYATTTLAFSDVAGMASRTFSLKHC